MNETIVSNVGLDTVNLELKRLQNVLKSVYDDPESCSGQAIKELLQEHGSFVLSRWKFNPNPNNPRPNRELSLRVRNTDQGVAVTLGVDIGESITSSALTSSHVPLEESDWNEVTVVRIQEFATRYNLGQQVMEIYLNEQNLSQEMISRMLYHDIH